MKHIILYLLLVISALSYAQDGSRGSKPNTITKTSEGTKRAIVIGVSNYNADDLKLKFADNDAALFKNYLTDIEGLENNNICLLINKDAVALNIVQELKKQFNLAKDGDVLYIYFAGHGDVVEDFGEKEGFLLAADANTNQEYYSGGVVPLALLNKAIDNLTLKGVNVVLILDACRSGFVFEKGTKKNMGTLQAMFENSTKILSCGADELSYESADLKHGYFTYYLVKGLSGLADDDADKNIIYRELDDYLYDNVNTTVVKKHNKRQTPILRTKNDRAIMKVISNDATIINFEDIASTIENTKQLAARGITKTDLKNKSNGETISRFNAAIQRNSYYGKSSSAYEIYKSVLNDNTISEGIKSKMQSILLKTLSNEAQSLINLYIEGSTYLPPSKEFVRQSKHLDICLELMGEDIFLYNRVKASQMLLEAYAIIRSNNHVRFEAAKRKLNSAIQLEPRAAYIHNALGLVYNNQRKYDSAFYHFKKAKSLIQTWQSPDVNISDNFIDQYKFDEATAYLDNSIGKNGNETNLKLGEINMLQGNYQLAESYFQKALKTDPNNVLAQQKMSELQRLKGNAKAAIEWYQKALKTDSSDAITSMGLLNYIKLNNIENEQAEKLLLNALDNNPESSTAYSEYADFIRLKYKRLTRLRIADSLYDKAIKLNPYNIEAYSGKAWLKSQMRKPLEAQNTLEACLAANPNDANAFLLFGQYLELKSNNTVEAVAMYKKAIETNDKSINAYTSIVRLYNEQGEVQKSIDLLQTAIKNNSKAPDFWYLLGQTYFKTKNYNRAIDAFEKAVTIDKSFVKGNKSLGFSQVEINQTEKAASNLISASQNAANSNTTKEIVEFLHTAAKDKSKFGTPEEVTKLYKLAYDIDSKGNTALIYANHLYLNNNPEEALKVALPSISKANSKSLNADILRVLTKASIDLNNKENANYYYNYLTKIDKTTDYLLASVYLKFNGNFSESETMRRKVNQNLFRSNKLKELYSGNTIETYILN
jgi:tetratricopeptide (TPR) repeat protein